MKCSSSRCQLLHFLQKPANALTSTYIHPSGESFLFNLQHFFGTKKAESQKRPRHIDAAAATADHREPHRQHDSGRFILRWRDMSVGSKTWCFYRETCFSPVVCFPFWFLSPFLCFLLGRNLVFELNKCRT